MSPGFGRRRCTAGAHACWLLLCMLFGSGLNVCCEQLLSTGQGTKMYRSVGKYICTPYQLKGTKVGREQPCSNPVALRCMFDRARGPKVGWSVRTVCRAPHCAAARPAIPVPVPKSRTLVPTTRWRFWPRNAARFSPCTSKGGRQGRLS